MNRYEMRRQFGRNPDTCAVLVWAIQQALKGIGKRHPDGKRQRKSRLRDLTIYRLRSETKEAR
jgi:hypothetical protein